ncbi:DNA mismatch repair protein MutL [hydrothermal vent metagenome]|uniref:DNA mismatch repair protein MutL n=1 Tax=hydrothermal vent metagenome TaxID=652676 RepID=A0A3B0V3V7_9ZZZZ
MSLIRILPENLANQIAAGEVVERPASVVKELVENSIDAGAKNIAVEIEGAGCGLIRVIDDGMGMDEDDMLLSLERHATSKLRDASELTAINTLGFRGEAIPSIASVSKLIITSRRAAAPLGSRLESRFGKLIKVHEMGAAPGTVLEIRNLFANVPARRKFLKSTATETAHIDEAVRSYALIHNEIGFSLQVKGRRFFDLVPGSGEERVRRALGLRDVELLTLPGKRQETEIRVGGYLLLPEEETARSARLWLFVNGRVVKDRMLAHAAAEGMRDFLMKGRRPAGVLFIDLPPTGVDVNVHPAKQEIRFQHSNQVHGAVVAAVHLALKRRQDELRNKIFKPRDNAALETGEPFARECSQGPELKRQDESAVRGELSVSKAVESIPAAVSPIRAEEEAGEYQADGVLSGPEFEPGGAGYAEDMLFEVPAGSDSLPPGVCYAGQFMETYLLFEFSKGLLVIDQHAAQERLLFEDLKHSYQRRALANQCLMFPEMVEVAISDMQILEQYSAEISRLGLEIDYFGGSNFVIKAVPALLAHLSPMDILRDVLARFEDAGNAQGPRGGMEAVLAGMACKAAVKAGQRLSRLEAEHLLIRMMTAGVFSHCPHGRPVVKIFSCRDIKKWFHRT